MRQYAAEKLSDARQTGTLRRRQAEYLVELASQQTNDSATSVLEQLEAELGNLRAIMPWARVLPDAGCMSLHLVTAFQGLWNQRAQQVNEMLA